MVSLVVRVWWCCCGVLCCLGGWWGPLVDVDVALGDFDAVGAMACGVVVSTLGWGPGGLRWWRLFASRGGVLGGVVDGRFSNMFEQVAIRFLLPSDRTFPTAIPRKIHQSLELLTMSIDGVKIKPRIVFAF